MAAAARLAAAGGALSAPVDKSGDRPPYKRLDKWSDKWVDKSVDKLVDQSADRNDDASDDASDVITDSGDDADPPLVSGADGALCPASAARRAPRLHGHVDNAGDKHRDN